MNELKIVIYETLIELHFELHFTAARPCQGMNRVHKSQPLLTTPLSMTIFGWTVPNSVTAMCTENSTQVTMIIRFQNSKQISS